MDLAIFDLDHTLIACDSEVRWIDFLYARGLLDNDFLNQRDELSRQYTDGSVDADEFVRFQLSSLSPFPRHMLDALYPEYLHSQILPAIYAEGRDLVAHHCQRGDTLLLLSATNEFLITPIGHELGITHIIGVVPEQNNTGDFSGGFVGTPSFREGKIVRLQAWLAERGQTQADFNAIHFYSDSINDLPLLKAVSHPYAINPDARLLAEAQAHGWPVRYFHAPA